MNSRDPVDFAFYLVRQAIYSACTTLVTIFYRIKLLKGQWNKFNSSPKSTCLFTLSINNDQIQDPDALKMPLKDTFKVN